MIITNIPRYVMLSPGNTTVILIEGLQDEVSGDFLNVATVTATLVDQNNNPDAVLNGIPMPYLAGTNGNYQGIVPAAFNAVVGSGYTLQINASQGGVSALWSIPARVVLRTSN